MHMCMQYKLITIQQGSYALLRHFIFPHIKKVKAKLIEILVSNFKEQIHSVAWYLVTCFMKPL